MTCMSTVRFSTGFVMVGRGGSDGEVDGMGLRALQEAPDERVELGALEEERVVPKVGRELGVARALAGAQERERDRAVLLGREEPVAGEADHEGLGPYRGERLLERPVGPRGVELVDGAGDVEVGVRVEAVDEALPLVA